MSEITDLYDEMTNWIDFLRHVRVVSLEKGDFEVTDNTSTDTIHRMFALDENELSLTFSNPDKAGQLCVLQIKWSSF